MLQNLQICGKKWYWPLFINLLNTTVVAAWRIHCQLENQKMINVDFRRQVTLCLIKIQEKSDIAAGVAAELPLDVRPDCMNQFLGHAATQGRCKVCNKNITSMCTKCNI